MELRLDRAAASDVMISMIRVTAFSRLHFGVLALPARAASHWPAADDEPPLPVRHFGGVGLMIDQPGVEVTVAPAGAWSASGPSADRALAFAKYFVATLDADSARRGFEIIVRRCPPEHVGLGAGTQLALAVARGLALATGHADWDSVELARRTGRGLRSSLGIHGFRHGGLLVEGGKSGAVAISPLLTRLPFPEEWRILLILPHGLQGDSGLREREAFTHLAKRDDALRHTESLCRIVLLNLLPALAERDLPAFGEALHVFNRRVGAMFSPWQGGVYSHPVVGELIAWLRKEGVRGVGQSSWGPAVFAIERAEVLERVRSRFLEQTMPPCDMLMCNAANHGARAEIQ